MLYCMATHARTVQENGLNQVMPDPQVNAEEGGIVKFRVQSVIEHLLAGIITDRDETGREKLRKYVSLVLLLVDLVLLKYKVLNLVLVQVLQFKLEQNMALTLTLVLT